MFQLIAEILLTTIKQMINLLTVTLGFFLLVKISFTQIQACLAAPEEIGSYLDMLHFSLQETESCKREKMLAQVRQLADKLRIIKLLQEIQQSTDLLREELNKILVIDYTDKGNEKSHIYPGKSLRLSTRLLWSMKRSFFLEHLHKLDHLRIRYLAIYLELIVTNASSSEFCDLFAIENNEMNVLSPPSSEFSVSPSQSSKMDMPLLEKLPSQFTKKFKQYNPANLQTPGWTNVVAELQKSPLLQKRHNLREI